MPNAEKAANLSKVTFRLQQETWNKLQWLATEQGITRPGLIRQLLAVAVRNVKPPNHRGIEGITSREWEAWQSLAESRGVPVSELVRDIMERVTSKANSQ